MDWAFWTTGALLATGGLAIAALALFKDRSPNRRRCPKCWYDMSGIPSLQCPECGKTATAENKLFKTRRRWRWAVLGCVLLIAGGGTAGTPKLKRDGPFALVPTPMLNFVASFFDEQAEQIYKDRPGAFNSVRAALGPWERVLLARHCLVRLEQGLTAGLDRREPQGDEQALSTVLNRAQMAGAEQRLLKPRLLSILNDRWQVLEQAMEQPDAKFEWREPNRPLDSFGFSWGDNSLDCQFELFVMVICTLVDLEAFDELDRLGERCAHVRALAVFWALILGGDQIDSLKFVVRALDDTRDIGVSDSGRQLEVRDVALFAIQEAVLKDPVRIEKLEDLARDEPKLRDQIEQTISAIRANMESGN